MTTLHLKKSIVRSPLRLAFLLIPLALALAWLALSHTAQAADGGLPNYNTAEGSGALSALTTGDQNTAIGVAALNSNTIGGNNTATGAFALQNNTDGTFNTADGDFALALNTIGYQNTATGAGALNCNVTGNNNTANGIGALNGNTTGNTNTADGAGALNSNTTGGNNTANGAFALEFNTTGHDNTGNGYQALYINSGSNNIALGSNAGSNLTTGNNNIDIGALGVAGESNTIRIGKVGVQKIAYMQGISGATVASGVTVIVGSNGHLGTVTSSARFKEAIKPMDKASEAILALQPVTFRYKHELDPDSIPQFGLVAEQVEKVNPDLVVRDTDGKINTVRYEAVNAMLLNEFLKEHRKVEQQATTIAQQRKDFQASITKLEATMAQQQKDFQATAARQQEQIEALTAGLQKVSAQVEMSRPAQQMVADNQ
jgi:hypothetical protein